MLYTCPKCCTSCEVTQTYLMARSSPTFCPYCGHKGLKSVKSSFASVNALMANFPGMPRDLIMALMLDWSRDPDTTPLFVDYIKRRVEEA